MKVVLELQDQPSNVRRITVRHDIVIGRGSDCNLRLSAPQVSRRHCFLRVGRDSVSVTDLDSSNGTYIDGARITAGKRCDIADGAQLALGPIRFIIHLRSETLSAGGAKSDLTAVVPDAAQGSEAGRDSVPRRGIVRGGSMPRSQSQIADSDVPMDYNLEHGGDSAESHETTAKPLDHPYLTAGMDLLTSPAPDPMDSRLEIIDFGRRLSRESLSGAESDAVPQDDVVGKSESVNDEEPQWESAIIDSSDSQDDLDVLSTVHGSDLESRSDHASASDAEVPVVYEADDSGAFNDQDADTISPPPFPDLDVPGNKFVVAAGFLNVSTDDELATGPAESDDDEIDPSLQSFLKGF